MHFEHQKLDVYRVALGLARWAATIHVRRNVKEQLVRAMDSVVLNIAEGTAHPRGADARRNFYRIAFGSAAEAAACLDLIDGPADRIDEIIRVGSMLSVMIRQ